MARHTRRVILTVAILLIPCAAAAWATSLWPEEHAHSPFADHRAFAVGDVLTVLVEERSQVSSSSDMSLSKSTSTEAGLKALAVGKGAGASPVFTGEKPTLEMESDRSFDGGGEYSLSGRMSTQLAVVVREVLPNGNLVVEGTRERNQAGQRVIIRISGLVRPEDVSSNNTVSSSALAQGKIEFNDKGPVSRSARRGWFNAALDFIWPF